MKHTLSAFLFFSLLMTACKNNQPHPAPKANTTKDSIARQPDFFPVPEYIGGQLKMIDSLQLPLSMSVTINNKTALRIATDQELRSWAQQFQQPDISDPAVKKMYTETSIADQATPSVTLIYTTGNAALPVQKINVFVKPDPVENDKVTGIYMEKIFVVRDTVFHQQLYWKSGKNLQVITEKKFNGTTLPVEQVKITWNE